MNVIIRGEGSMKIPCGLSRVIDSLLLSLTKISVKAVLKRYVQVGSQEELLRRPLKRFSQVKVIPVSLFG